MNRKRLVALGAATIVAVGGVVSLTVGSASALPPANSIITDATFGPASTAEGINIAASGFLTVAPTLDTRCVGPTPVIMQDLATLNLGSLALAKGLHGECNIAARTDLARAKTHLASISLLGGKIKLAGVDSQCQISVSGSAFCGSDVAALNGQPLAPGPLSIVIPGVAAVYVNHNVETVSITGVVTLQTTAVEVDVFPVVVAGHVVRQAEKVIIGQSTLTTHAG